MNEGLQWPYEVNTAISSHFIDEETETSIEGLFNWRFCIWCQNWDLHGIKKKKLTLIITCPALL